MIRKYTKNIYNTLFSEEQRYWFYKLRHLNDFSKLKTKIYSSAKGDFSLKPFQENQCLFIHITKSAGTSVAKSLFGYLPYHYTAIEYRVIYGRRAFNRYFKFAFVRNPWDRLYSAYSYLKGGGWDEQDQAWYLKEISNIEDFNSFVLDWLTPERINSHIHLKPQFSFICDDKGKILIDFLGYFESVNEDYSYISELLGLKQVLAHTNISNRVDYRHVYTPQAIDKVAILYLKDIDMFGYDFNCLKHRKLVRGGNLVDM